MAGTRRSVLAAVALGLVAVPVLGQSYSEGFRFLKAVRERDGTEVEAILANPSSVAVNSREQGSGEGALHIVVRRRDSSWLAFMLSHGARPDLQNGEGATPLVLAAQMGWQEGAEALLERRANPNLGNNQGETPLVFAVRRLDLGMVRLLMSRGANPNQTDHVTGNAPIDYARQDRRAAAILRELETPRTSAARPAQP